MKKMLVIAALLTVSSVSAFAQRYQHPTPSHRPSNRDYSRDQMHYINSLQLEIKQSINRGIERNWLTRKEAKSLIKEYERIEARERHMSRDRFISQRDAKELVNDLKRLQYRVQKESRDFDRGNDRWARY
jgi:hypothetical protein